MIGDLTKAIESNRCILFLGPLLNTANDTLCLEFTRKLDDQQTGYDRNAAKNLYYLSDRFIKNNHTRDEVKARDEVKEILSQVYETRSDVYQQLAGLPFNTVVNFGFDLTLQNEIDKLHYEFIPGHYDYNGEERTHITTDKDSQLVYNLFGSVDNPDSIALTESDQLNFLRRINSNPKLPDSLLSRIKDEAKTYLFIGFNFDDWPYRFLLDTLQIQSKKGVMPNNPDSQIAVMNRDFYTSHFGINFVNEDPVGFIGKLVTEYKKSKTEHRFGYISYHENDKEFVTNFREHLDQSKLASRISFWDPSSIMGGELSQEVTNENLNKSTVYIVFLSGKFLSSPAHLNELQAVIQRPNVLIFAIIARVCLWQVKFNELKRRAALILPGIDDVLENSGKNASSEDYIKIVKSISSKIR